MKEVFHPSPDCMPSSDLVKKQLLKRQERLHQRHLHLVKFRVVVIMR